jgi:hypothetical protein
MSSAFIGTALESSGNDTGGSLRFQPSSWHRNTLSFDKYFHISTISQGFSPKTIDRVPEVQGLLFAPCTVGPCGLPNRPPIYSQAPGPCLLFTMVNSYRLDKTLFIKATTSAPKGEPIASFVASFVVSNQAETIPGAHCGSNHLLFVEFASCRRHIFTIHISHFTTLQDKNKTRPQSPSQWPLSWSWIKRKRHLPF